MARELDAKVAQVVSATVIAINVGAEAGVNRDDAVIVWRFVDVKDPDTGELLGTVRLQNLRLTVYKLEPRFALARVESDNAFGFGNLFKPSKVIATSNRAVDQEIVKLSTGDEVTVIIEDGPFPSPEDDEEGAGGAGD